MISPCHFCWLGLFVGCEHVIIGEKRYIPACAHVLFKGEKESIVGTRRESNGRSSERQIPIWVCLVFYM